MDDNKKIDRRNFEVNVLELMKYIGKRFVVVLFISIAVAGIVLFAKYISDKNKFSTVQGEEHISYESQMYESNLEQIKFYETAYESRKEYEKESILMSLDSYNINSATVDFFINGKEEDIVDIMTAYSLYGNEGGLIADMCEKDNSIKEKYLYEIISVTCSDYEDYGKSSVMNVRVYGKTREQCQHFVEIIKDVLNEYSTHLNDIGIENQIKQCNENYFVDKDGNVFQIQRNFIALLTEIEDEISRLKEENALYEKQGIVPSNQVGQDEATNKASFDSKFFIIGLILGLIVAVCVYAFKFILSGKVKYATELSDARDVEYIGSVHKSKKKSEGLQKLSCKIKWICEYHNTDSISIVGGFSKLEPDVQELFNAKITECGVNSKIVGDIVNDVDAMDKVLPGENVIIAVLENETSYNYIDSLIENCILKKANIIGYVYFGN